MLEKKKKVSVTGFEAFPRHCLNRRRSRNEVVFDILRGGLGGSNKTRLMYSCNLNFVRFSPYLRELLEAELIECLKGNPEGVVLYRTTDKGRELLRVLRKAGELLSI